MAYFVVHTPTPVLNTSHFKRVFGETLPFDKNDLVREVEMIALEGMIFTVINKMAQHILQVKSDEYRANKLFVDGRFGYLQVSKPQQCKKQCPSLQKIITRVRSCVGLPYLWGGNCSAGIPEWKRYYPPPRRPLTRDEEVVWSFKGIDCSGLLYEATEGYVPRNTREQVKIGEEVSIDSPLKPLDLIFFKDHIVIVLNENEVIESRLILGVVVSPLRKRLKEIGNFTIRRFHPETIAPQRSQASAAG